MRYVDIDGGVRYVKKEFRGLNDRTIHRLIRDFSRDNNLHYKSCLDVGCGRAQYYPWIQQVEFMDEPRKYIGIESDRDIINKHHENGLDVRHPDDAGECKSDLSLCLEVIEHLRPDETKGFLEFVRNNTNKLVAFTTPNFEYWNGQRQVDEYKECRWIPDHFSYFRPDSLDPHDHKQAMTPENMDDYFSVAFPSDEWDYEIFRSWPWVMEDQTNGEKFELYFKLFAIAWRKGA